MTHQCERPSRVLCWNTLYEHVCLRCDNGRIDKTEEEEAANERANGIVCGFGIFALHRRHEIQFDRVAFKDSPVSDYESAYRSTEYHTGRSPCSR